MTGVVRGVPALLLEPVALAGGALGVLLGRERTGSAARARGAILAGRRVAVGPGVTFVEPGRIQLGARVTLYGGAYLDAAGAQGRIAIGDDTHVDRLTVLYGQGGLSIGSKCAIASGVTIYTQTNQFRADPMAPIVDQPTLYAPVTIGDDVWVGARAVILPGVRVGDHAVIAAGAVVRRDVAPWQIVGGVPARVIGDRRATERA